MPGRGKWRPCTSLQHLSDYCSLLPMKQSEFFSPLTFPLCILTYFLAKPPPQGSCTPLMVATMHPQAAGVPIAAQYPLPLALCCGAGRPSLLEQTATVLVKRDPLRNPPLTRSSFISSNPVLPPCCWNSYSFFFSSFPRLFVHLFILSFLLSSMLLYKGKITKH